VERSSSASPPLFEGSCTVVGGLVSVRGVLTVTGTSVRFVPGMLFRLTGAAAWDVEVGAIEKMKEWRDRFDFVHGGTERLLGGAHVSEIASAVRGAVDAHPIHQLPAPRRAEGERALFEGDVELDGDPKPVRLRVSTERVELVRGGAHAIERGQVALDAARETLLDARLGRDEVRLTTERGEVVLRGASAGAVFVALATLGERDPDPPPSTPQDEERAQGAGETREAGSPSTRPAAAPLDAAPRKLFRGRTAKLTMKAVRAPAAPTAAPPAAEPEPAAPPPTIAPPASAPRVGGLGGSRRGLGAGPSMAPPATRTAAPGPRQPPPGQPAAPKPAATPPKEPPRVAGAGGKKGKDEAPPKPPSRYRTTASRLRFEQEGTVTDEALSELATVRRTSERSLAFELPHAVWTIDVESADRELDELFALWLSTPWPFDAGLDAEGYYGQAALAELAAPFLAKLPGVAIGLAKQACPVIWVGADRTAYRAALLIFDRGLVVLPLPGAGSRAAVTLAMEGLETVEPEGPVLLDSVFLRSGDRPVVRAVPRFDAKRAAHLGGLIAQATRLFEHNFFQGPNRRVSFRTAPPGEVSVPVRAMRSEDGAVLAGTPQVARLADLSAEGCRVSFEDEIPGLASLELEIPTEGAPTVLRLAITNRAKPDAFQGRGWEYGGAFAKLEPQELRRTQALALVMQQARLQRRPEEPRMGAPEAEGAGRGKDGGAAKTGSSVPPKPGSPSDPPRRPR
jgi:hypothetical protein